MGDCGEAELKSDMGGQDEAERDTVDSDKVSSTQVMIESGVEYILSSGSHRSIYNTDTPCFK